MARDGDSKVVVGGVKKRGGEQESGERCPACAASIGHYI